MLCTVFLSAVKEYELFRTNAHTTTDLKTQCRNKLGFVIHCVVLWPICGLLAFQPGCYFDTSA